MAIRERYFYPGATGANDGTSLADAWTDLSTAITGVQTVHDASTGVTRLNCKTDSRYTISSNLNFLNNTISNGSMILSGISSTPDDGGKALFTISSGDVFTFSSNTIIKDLDIECSSIVEETTTGVLAVECLMYKCKIVNTDTGPVAGTTPVFSSDYIAVCGYMDRGCFVSCHFSSSVEPNEPNGDTATILGANSYNNYFDGCYIEGTAFGVDILLENFDWMAHRCVFNCIGPIPGSDDQTFQSQSAISHREQGGSGLKGSIKIINNSFYNWNGDPNVFGNISDPPVGGGTIYGNGTITSNTPEIIQYLILNNIFVDYVRAVHFPGNDSNFINPGFDRGVMVVNNVYSDLSTPSQVPFDPATDDSLIDNTSLGDGNDPYTDSSNGDLTVNPDGPVASLIVGQALPTSLGDSNLSNNLDIGGLQTSEDNNASFILGILRINS